MKKFVLTLLIVILAVGAGVAGWKYWQSKNAPAPQQTQTDPTQGGKYLVIKEWGVRFIVPDELKGLTYGINDTDDTTSFEIKQLADLPNNNCKLITEASGSGKTGGSGVRLHRTTQKLTDQAFYSHVNILEQGNYWYHSAMPKGSCIKDGGQQEVDLTVQLNTALTTLEALP